jgi:hypothetical protein
VTFPGETEEMFVIPVRIGGDRDGALAGHILFRFQECYRLKPLGGVVVGASSRVVNNDELSSSRSSGCRLYHHALVVHHVMLCYVCLTLCRICCISGDLVSGWF